MAKQLSKWKSFPVDAASRPIVLTGAEAHTPGAYTRIVRLAFDDPRTLPRGPAEAGGYPVNRARDALNVLHDIAEKHRSDQKHVVLAGAAGIRLGTAQFWTDRGLQELPAWLVTYRTSEGHSKTTTVSVLAILLA